MPVRLRQKQQTCFIPEFLVIQEDIDVKTRKLLSVLLIMILLVSLSPAAFAAVEFASDEASFTGEHDATVFLAGSNPVTDANIGGILFTAGNTVTTSGSCEYAFVAGNVLSFGSNCAKDAFIGGNSIAVSGSVGRDLMSAANTLNLSGSVGRDLFAGAKTVTISGEIGGDVLLAADEIRIADGARIGGTLHYNSDAVITGPTAILSEASAYSVSGEDASNYSSLFSYIQEYSAVQDSHVAVEGSAAPADSSAPAESSTPAESPAAAVSSAPAESTTTTTTTTTANTPAPAVSSAESGSSRSSVGPKIKSRVFSYIGLVLLAFALLWLTPLWEKLDSVYTGADFSKYAAAFGIGFGVMVALPIAVIILMITGFGMRPALVLLFVYFAGIVAAPVFLGFFVGVLIWRRLCKRPVNYWAELAIGILVWRLASLIPFVKLATSLVTVPLALGVLARLLGKKKAEPAAAALAVKADSQKPKPQKV